MVLWRSFPFNRCSIRDQPINMIQCSASIGRTRLGPLQRSTFVSPSAAFQRGILPSICNEHKSQYSANNIFLGLHGYECWLLPAPVLSFEAT